ncbi:hypothetical protein GCM10018791_60350 [Streptomyces zaomyceticus]|nr:hypothetical protein GCM10018791_60350 [Streptomyces zaomyceticus]
MPHEDVFRLTGDTTEPVEDPAEELAPAVGTFHPSLTLHRETSRRLRQRENRSVPERFQSCVEQVQGSPVGVGTRGHFITVGRPFRTSPAREAIGRTAWCVQRGT